MTRENWLAGNPEGFRRWDFLATPDTRMEPGATENQAAWQTSLSEWDVLVKKGGFFFLQERDLGVLNHVVRIAILTDLRSGDVKPLVDRAARQLTILTPDLTGAVVNLTACIGNYPIAPDGHVVTSDEHSDQIALLGSLPA